MSFRSSIILSAVAALLGGCEPWHFAYRNDTGRPVSITTVRTDGTVGVFSLPAGGSMISTTRARDISSVEYQYDGVRCSLKNPASAAPDIRWNEMRQMTLEACENQHD